MISDHQSARPLRCLRRWLTPIVVAAAALAPAMAQAQSADVVVNHADSPDPGPARGVFTYTIRVDNNGPNNALNVRLADTLPPGSTFVSATTSAGTCAAPASGVVNCTLGNIPFTQPTTTSQTVTIKVRLPTAGVYTNTVSTTSDTSDPNAGNNTNNAESTTAVSASDLALSVAAPATITAGQSFNYTLTATNLGPDPVPADGTVTIAFTVPSGSSVTSAPTGPGWSCTPATGYPRSTGTISCTRQGPFASGASATLTVPAVTNVSGTVSAAFALSSTMPDGDQTNNTATASVASAAGSDVAITITASAATVAQGSNVAYTLTPRHNGGIAPGSTGNGVITVTDTLGTGLTFVSAAGTGWTCTFSAPVVTCTRPGPFNGGPFADLPTITVNATASGVGTLTNSAAISIPETDPVPGNNSASVNIVSSNGADLQVTKGVSLSPVVPNQPFNFTLNVRNNGPLAVPAGQQITLTDDIPPGVTVTSRPIGGGFTCTPATGYPIAGPMLRCTTTAVLNANSTATITVNAVVPTASGPITNTACAQLEPGARTDPNSANNCGSATVNSTAQRADLVVDSKTASPGTINAGEELTYVVTVRNAGSDAATNVVVTDQLNNLINTGGFRSAVPSKGTCSPSGVTNGPSVNLSCNLGTLALNETATVTIKVLPTVATSGARPNTASINSTDIGDPNRNNNSASVTSTVNALVDLQASKTATPSPVRAGTPLTYVATVKNNGPSTANNVTLVDALPANATFLSLVSVSGGGSCTTIPAPGQTGGTLACNWPSIGNGAQNTVTYRVRPLTSATGSNVANAINVATATQEFNTVNNRATTTTPVTAAQLDILVNKADSIDPVSLGQNTVYTIQIDNAGPSLGTNVQMVDVFPAPPPANGRTAIFSYEGGLTVNNGGTCVEPALGSTTGTLRCAFPSLEASQRATVTYAMKAQSLTVAGALTGTTYNEARVSVDEPETLLTNNRVVHDTTARRFLENANLAIRKTTTAAQAMPGDTIDYQLRVGNAGPAPSSGAQVNDTLPVGITFVSGPGCTEAAGTLSCAVGPLNSGAERTFDLRLKLDDRYTGANPLVNTARLDAPGDPDPVDNSSSASTPVVGPNRYNADLALSKTTPASTVAPGGTIGYTIVVRNNGPDASDGATVRDRVPAGTRFVSGAGCSEGAGVIGCAIGPLAPNASRTFELSLKLDDIYTGARPLLNTAAVDAPGDPELNNNSASASTPVAGPNLINADLALTKATGAASVTAGGSIDYTLTVRNNGPDASDGARLSDPLPAGTTLVSADGGCSASLGNVQCAIGPLAAQAQRTFNIRLRLDDPYTGASPLVNAATVEAPGDPDLVNNRASVSTPLAGPPRNSADLALSKRADVTSVAPGGTIAYLLNVKNNGPDASDGALLIDPAPPGTRFVAAPGCTLEAGTARCAVGPLTAGAQRSFTLQLALDSPYTGARPLVNSARLEAPSDPDPTDNQAATATPVRDPDVLADTGADLALSKTSAATGVAPGGTIDYLLTVRNNGPQRSAAATLVDPLPPGTTLVAAEGCVLGGDNAVRCALGPLTVGEAQPFTLRLRLDEAYTGARPLVNRAAVSAANDPNADNNQASVTTPVGDAVMPPPSGRADLDLGKTTQATQAAPGAGIGYLLTVRNLGPDASNGAFVLDPLPEFTRLVSAPGCTVADDRVLRCAVGALANGASKTFEVQLALTADYPAARPLLNRASLEAPGDPNAANNRAEVSTPVTASVPIAIPVDSRWMLLLMLVLLGWLTWWHRVRTGR